MTKEEIFNKLNITCISIKQKGNAKIINTNDRKYVMKKQNRKSDFYEYLLTRKFSYFPRVYTKVDDEIELMDYIESQETPNEQKLEDIAYLISILHIETYFDKNIDIDQIKEIYESMIDKQNNLSNYYHELQNIIEEEIYMSPANYLLIRNISTIYLALNKSREYIEKWYSKVKDTCSIRYAYTHGNLDINHLIESNNLYLISWDKSKIDFPISDIENFYRKNFLDINIMKILEIYENKFTLKNEEKDLLFSQLLLPDRIDYTGKEYYKTKQISNMILYIEKTLSNLKDNSKKANNNTSE